MQLVFRYQPHDPFFDHHPRAMARRLAWLADEDRCGGRLRRGRGARRELDIEWLLENRVVVFMIGAEEAQTAPLLTALTAAYIARGGLAVIAALAPGGRLDPPV